jgi:hypothetical protein
MTSPAIEVVWGYVNSSANRVGEEKMCVTSMWGTSCTQLAPWSRGHATAEVQSLIEPLSPLPTMGFMVEK